MSDPDLEPTAHLADLHMPGDQIDRYKLLEKIGEGGCGIVYMAEQEKPVRRRVALKVIKPGMDTREIIARFEVERQALALMDHPYIARVFDGGATDAGRPYFVMELVRGVRITDYCDQQNLPTRQRLELFVQICQAIQHAHQKGVIHRDLKPSNVLVTINDGVAVPKVIDFGVAKATGQGLTDKTLFTKFQQLIGTPAYMSPEQAEMTSVDIDTRSDIYSLGALLYELLTGRTPFDARKVLKAGVEETLRTIREDDPVRPSARLSTLSKADLTTVGRKRQTEAPRLVRLLRGDLDWIVMRCLEKDRARRYETANGLAADIQRHLDNVPVLASPPGNLYRFHKTMRRHMLAFAAGGTILASLFIGFGLTFWQYIEKSEAYRQASSAQTKERKAREEAQEAQRNERRQYLDAETKGNRLAKILSQTELQNVEQMFTAGDSSGALAHLARLLRRDPTNRLAAERTLSALTHRTFALPRFAPIQHAFPFPVYSAEFSPDGQRLLTASGDKSVRIWDAGTGQILCPSLEHDAAVTCSHFSPDGKKVVTACSDDRNSRWNYCRVWDVVSGQPLTPPLLHKGLVSSARFSLDGKRIVTASFDGAARIWESENGQSLTEIRPGRSVLGGALIDAQFSPDGKRLVTASFGGSARVWNAATGEPLGQPLEHGVPVSSAEFSPDGQHVVTASGDGYWLGGTSGGRVVDRRYWDARVWDAATGRQLSAPMPHGAGITSARFSPDGLRVLTTSLDNTARIWDATTGQPLTESMRHNSRVRAGEFSTDGQRIVTASEDKSARVWDAKTGRPLFEPLRHEDVVRSAHFSLDGQWLVTASMDGTARIWDVRRRWQLTSYFAPLSSVRSARFSTDGQRVITASIRTAQIWDAKSTRDLTEPLYHNTVVNSARFSPDAQRVVVAAGSNAYFWDASRGQPLAKPLRHAGSVRDAQFSPDGRRVVTASQDNTARVWDATTGEPITEPLRHDSLVWSAQFSPDGMRVITASMDRTVGVWDVNTSQPMVRALRHKTSVSSAQYSTDGRWIVTTSPSDKTSQIWNSQTGELLAKPLTHRGGILSALFSQNGSMVVTASEDNTARVWDTPTGQPLIPPLQHSARVTSASFSRDGLHVLTTSYDRTARVWDVTTGLPSSEVFEHDDPVTKAEFSPDDEVVLTIAGHAARVWEVPNVSLPVPEWVPKLAEVVAQSRIDERGLPEAVDIAELEDVKKRVENSSPTNAWIRWAKWLFAEPATRTISPFSVITISDYVNLRIKQSDGLVGDLLDAGERQPDEGLPRLNKLRALERLRETVSLDPTNGSALARLARMLLAQEPSPDSRQTREAVWLSQRAAMFAPGEREVQKALMEATGRPVPTPRVLEEAPGEAQPDPDKDIPLAEAIRLANKRFPSAEPLTEDEVVAAIQAIKLKHRDIKEDTYECYMRVVRERVLPRNMHFHQITNWETKYGRFRVDWKDLRLDSPMGGFNYRIRARFISSQPPVDKDLEPAGRK